MTGRRQRTWGRGVRGLRARAWRVAAGGHALPGAAESIMHGQSRASGRRFPSRKEQEVGRGWGGGWGTLHPYMVDGGDEDRGEGARR